MTPVKAVQNAQCISTYFVFNSSMLFKPSSSAILTDDDVLFLGFLPVIQTASLPQ